MREQKKTVTLLYGGISAALIVVVATVALVAAPPAPPSMAEYAPSAIDSIDDAPDNQQSQFGVGDGECPAGMVCDPITGEVISDPQGRGTSAIIDRARVRRCVGDPPRQIEDPQSPPCVNYWEGDNGGATSRGVTRDEIRVGVLGSVDGRMPLFVEFFNRRFEFYGRKMRIVEVQSSAGTPEEQDAAAASADEASVFAVVGASEVSNTSHFNVYRSAAARRGIITIGAYDAQSSAVLERLHPYVWTYYAAFDQIARNLVEFGCGSLVGAPAAHAGPLLASRTRSFAILEPSDASGGGRHDVEPLAEGLRRCGAAVSVHEYTGTTIPSEGSENDILLADLSQRNVTTIIPLGHSGWVAELMRRASIRRYQPEWFLPGTIDQLYELNWQRAPGDQTQHLFAFGTDNKGLPEAERPSSWALREMGGQQADAAEERIYPQFWENQYHSLLLLASGIQSAGPQLTPTSFGDGLQKLRFPNPGAGAPDYWQAGVGFARGDHSMVDDFTLQSWDAAAPAYSVRGSDRGGWCYVDRGARWRLGSWPTGEPNLFDPDPRNCR